jgi:hypothetical protein
MKTWHAAPIALLVACLWSSPALAQNCWRCVYSGTYWCQPGQTFGWKSCSGGGSSPCSVQWECGYTLSPKRRIDGTVKPQIKSVGPRAEAVPASDVILSNGMRAVRACNGEIASRRYSPEVSNKLATQARRITV